MNKLDEIELILDRMKKNLEGLGQSILDIKKAKIAAEKAQEELENLKNEGMNI